MTTLPLSDLQPQRLDWRGAAARIAGAALVLALSAAIILGWGHVEALGAYGYPAVFLASLLSSATLLLPAPGLALVAAAGVSLDPLIVGLVAGSGAALGEMTAYLAGHSGRAVIQDRPLYRRIEGWMRRSGSLVLFTMAAIPNPIFDLGGLVAGALNMPAWRFLAATWLGKSLRFWLLALLGALAL